MLETANFSLKISHWRKTFSYFQIEIQQNKFVDKDGKHLEFLCLISIMILQDNKGNRIFCHFFLDLSNVNYHARCWECYSSQRSGSMRSTLIRLNPVQLLRKCKIYWTYTHNIVLFKNAAHVKFIDCSSSPLAIRNKEMQINPRKKQSNWSCTSTNIKS